ncbi:hypothetical protein PHMEG_0004547 [Phytophthora megakarya]|uniref:Reverse transcriptase domain-containing protein n=1 Tax=Phytophthora megakarya TaxID=4795 RepID=A0A225WV86_9STRA|nr:hypothetical protein PHMEG_0004547 [Phytophthora megakarya]
MTGPQPVFELVKASQLTSWDQESLVKLLRERHRYIESMKERSRTTQDVCATTEINLLDYLARYEFQKAMELITDADILSYVTARVGEVMNGHVPDVFEFFKQHLNMDLSEQDIEARIVKYFVDFDRIVEDHGFASVLAAGNDSRPNFRDRMKSRCKLLVENLSPAMLKTEIKWLVSLQNRETKTDDVALHKLILERVKTHQRYHLMHKKVQMNRKQPLKSDGGKPTLKSGRRKPEVKSASAKPVAGAVGGGKVGDSKATRARPPPKDDCSNFVQSRPTATEVEKQECYHKLHEVKVAKAKAVRTPRALGQFRVVVNDMIELPYRADTGSDANKLAACSPPVENTVLNAPVYLERPRGDQVTCRTRCRIDILLGTAAGPVHVRDVTCVIVDEEEEEFLLGNPTSVPLGFDINCPMEQVAVNDLPDDDGDDITVDPEVSRDDGIEVNALINEYFERCKTTASLTTVICGTFDLVLMNLLESSHVVLKHDSQPVCCKPRRYAPFARAYMRNYVNVLVEYGYVYTNNFYCRKAGGNEFCITCDYRGVNNMTVPVAASGPNLAVITSCVKGATAIRKFGLFKGLGCEVFSFQTDESIFTPRRVPQGASTMQTTFEDLINEHLLVHVDDVILFASSHEEYLQVLEMVLRRLKDLNLKRNSKKCTLYQESVTWCGKLVDRRGETQDPSRVASLVSLPSTENAAEL